MAAPPLPPHRALGRDFFVVGVELVGAAAGGATGGSGPVLQTAVHRMQRRDEGPERLLSVADWLVVTLRNAPHLLLRLLARAPGGDIGGSSSCYLLDLGGVRRLLLLPGDYGGSLLPERVPQLTLAVVVGAATDKVDGPSVFGGCSLQDALWEHVAAALDRTGSEAATRIRIVAGLAGSVGRAAIDPTETPAIRLWGRRGGDDDTNNDGRVLHLERVQHYDSLAEALGQTSGGGGASAKRLATAAGATVAQQPGKKGRPAKVATAANVPAEATAQTDVSKKTPSSGPVRPNSHGAAFTSTPVAVAAKAAADQPAPPKSAKKKHGRIKDPARPKRAGSAYNYFFMERLPLVRQRFPGETVAVHSKHVGREWKELADDERAKYEALAARDQERYRREMEHYVPQPIPLSDDNDEGDTDVGGVRKKRRKKDPDAPKRPVSAYLAFCNEMRPELKISHPDTPFGQLTKLVSEKWKALAPEDRMKYEDIAKNAKEKYEHDKAEYATSKVGGTYTQEQSRATMTAHDSDDDGSSSASSREKADQGSKKIKATDNKKPASSDSSGNYAQKADDSKKRSHGRTVEKDESSDTSMNDNVVPPPEKVTPKRKYRSESTDGAVGKSESKVSEKSESKSGKKKRKKKHSKGLVK